MILRILSLAAAAILLYLALSGTSDGNRNEGKLVMLCFSLEYLLLSIFSPVLSAWFSTPWGKLLLIPQLGTALYFALVMLLAVQSLAGRGKQGMILMVPGTSLDGERPSPLLEGRLRAAEAWLNRHPDACCVVSGGQVNDEILPEAVVMKRWLEEHGIAPERIRTEDRSQTTWENFVYTEKLLRGCGWDGRERILLATDSFHYGRCRMLAGRAGIPSTGLIPSPGSLKYSACWYFREILVYLKYAMEGIR